jgi:hypothetical protein
MKDSVRGKVNNVFGYHFEKFIFIQVVGKAQVDEVLPPLVAAEPVNNKDVVDAAFIQSRD